MTRSPALLYKSKPNGRTVRPFFQDKDSKHCFPPHSGVYLIQAGSETENTVFFRTGCWAVPGSLLLGFTNQSHPVLAPIGHNSPSGSTVFH